MTEYSCGATAEDVCSDQAGRQKTILVVDDFEATRTLIAVQLADLNYELDFARDGEEALRKIAQKRYDLVLMDIGMPKMDGHETVRRIRHWEKENDVPSTPVIAITAHSDLAQPDAGKSQWTSILHKPLIRLRLVQAVNAHLNKGRKETAAR